MQWLITQELVEYNDALTYMENKVDSIISGEGEELVWLLEHPPLYTSGSSGNDIDLLDNGTFPVYKTGRGGKYTYHGPGQRIAYVMLDLRKRTQDLKLFVNQLEQWLIDSLDEFGIKAARCQGRVGIWVNVGKPGEAKIAAIGIRVRKWVTYHGIAINLNPNLEHFKAIIPCGIKDFGVTSMHTLGSKCTMDQLDKVLQDKFEDIFI